MIYKTWLDSQRTIFSLSFLSDDRIEAESFSVGKYQDQAQAFGVLGQAQ